MSQKEKLIRRIKTVPKDMTFEELRTLLGHLGYSEDNKGRTSGSRVIFINKTNAPIRLHKPHGRNVLLPAQVRDILTLLEQEGLI